MIKPRSSFKQRHLRLKVRGFTLLEIVMVMSILALLAALLYPVFQQGKKQAYKTSCQTNLHQAWLAIALYQQNNDGDAIYGTDYEMGLPPRFYGTTISNTTDDDIASLLNIKSLHCHFYPSRFSTSGKYFDYNFMYQDPWQQANGQNNWEAYSRKFQANSILLTDENHNDANIPLFSPNFPKLGFGVNVGGELITKNKPGDMDILTWWSTDCSLDCTIYN